MEDSTRSLDHGCGGQRSFDLRPIFLHAFSISISIFLCVFSVGLSFTCHLIPF